MIRLPITSKKTSPIPQHTMPSKTYLACIGTRPEIIKMAPVYRELKARGNTVRLVHTGQHGAIADALYTFFEMQPDISIDLQRQTSSLSHLSSALINGVEHAMASLNPDAVLVQGDTTSALVGALVGYYHDKPVAHVEAGLRTHERDPFPEEKNREMIGRLAHWHFPPTAQSSKNLLMEGIDPERIHEVGNTVIDSAIWARARIAEASFNRNAVTPPSLSTFMARHQAKRLILVTAHRRENWGQPIRNIALAVARIVEDHDDVVVVWPVHPNPQVRADVEAQIHPLSKKLQRRICLTESLGYEALIALLVRCEFTLTDSGGIQEEASAFSKPVLVARSSTERQELVAAGGARLVGTEVADMHFHAGNLLNDGAAYRNMQVAQSPFGDGFSAQRIADVLSGTQPAVGKYMRAEPPSLYGIAHH
jgi:UDP-N-acetylglucosamine 2-epimerase (non-hydrolysing)